MSTINVKIKSVIGFSGNVHNGLNYSNDGRYIVYPLGSFVVIKNIKTGREAFLNGHSGEISCIAISNDSKKIATGQSNLTGVKADVILWDFEKARMLLENGEIMIGESCTLLRLRQHYGKIQDVGFSMTDTYIATLGGEDDNAVVVWETATGIALCGSPAAPDSTLCLAWLNGRDDRFVTAGYYNLRVWQLDPRLPKLHFMDAKMGSVRRVFQCISIQSDDHFAYCGTQTGDVFKIKIDRNEIRPPNDPDTVFPVMSECSEFRFASGVHCLKIIQNPSTRNNNILVGAGDGSISYLNTAMHKVSGTPAQVDGAVTSLTKCPGTDKFAIGTNQGNRYEISSNLSDVELKMSCHYGGVNDITFPNGCPDLVVTSSTGDVRIWNTRTQKELLRIQVPNLDCVCTLVTNTGSTIVTGWNDGKIRAFFPETGRMKFVIPDAHTDKVTALAIAGDDSSSPWRLISGGAEGKIRVWNVSSSHRQMIISLKEHRGAVNCIKVNRDHTQCVSASADGSCIVWDLERLVRIMAFFEPNVFLSVLYHPDESQILTCGTNFKITYWDASDGQAIRVIEGGDGPVTGLDIDSNGEFFVSVSDDKLMKIWHYDDGIPIAIGHGHSGKIKAVKISPDERSIVSVGSTGEIVFWEMPSISKLRDTIQIIMGDDH
jgi:WD40 repeat protein